MNVRRKTTQYLVAVLGAASGVLLRIPLWEELGAHVPYITFFPVVILSAWRGGLGPGLLCTCLSGIAAVYFFVEPVGSLEVRTAADGLGVVLFAGVGAFLSHMAQRMRNAEAAERSQRLLSAQTLASIGDGVIALNRERQITFQNDVAAQLTGWPNAAAQGRRVDEVFRVVSEETGQPGPDSIGQVFASGNPQQMVLAKLMAKDGREILIDQSAAPIRDTDGKVVGVVLVFRDVTSRRDAERALLASREGLRTTLESITDAFMALGPDWRFTYVNAAAERFLGRTRDELTGRNHWDVYPEMIGTALEEEYQRVMRERKAAAFDYYSKRSGRWLEVNAYPAGDQGISIYFRDITPRKQADAILAESRAETERTRDLLQTTLASIGDGVIATDMETRVTFLNPVAASLVGISAGEAIGRRIEEVFVIVNESTREPVENPAARAAREGVVVGLANHTILLALDGRETPIDDSAAPIRSADGSIVGAVLVFRDVTDRRAAEKALMDSEERLRLAIRVGEIGVWDWDVPSNRITWSERVYAMHGIKPGEFSGRIEDLSQLIHPEDRTNVERAIRAAVEAGAPYQVQLRALHPNGKVLWLETTGEVIRDDEGRPLRMLGATTDITQRKLAEAELRQQALELKRSNADLERFAIAASHDLQEPLRMVTIYSQLLSRRCQGKLDEDAAQYLEILLDGTKRMRTLIQDLLDYAQVAHEHRPLAQVDAAAVLKQVLRNCEAAVRESGAVVKSGPLPVVCVRESQLTQVFQNLIMNAIRYRSAASPQIEVSATRVDSEWVFAVQDNGIGIPPRQHTLVFELFKRLDSKSAGTGIGLALCQRIVDGYGGRIWVESEPGRGSTFFFTLPHTSDMPAPSAQLRSPMGLSE